MTVALERPAEPAEPAAASAMSLLDLAEMVSRRMPGHRAEIFGGQLVVTPLADGPHGESLTNLVLALATLHGGETRVIQTMSLWLPTGAEDHAVPDLAVVDEDYREHEAAHRCYEPSVFRMVVEITSTNWREDLLRKPAAYAAAGVPVYVIGDRTHREAVVLTDPRDGEYRTHSRCRPGESLVLPESSGAKIELDADLLLGPGKGAGASAES